MKGFNLVEVQVWNGLTYINNDGVPYDGLDFDYIPVFFIKYLDIELDISQDNTGFQVITCQRCNNVHKIKSLSEANKLDKMIDLHLGAYPF